MSKEFFTVSRDDEMYEAWPDLVLTDKGKMICVFTECAHHIDRAESRVMITESLDLGKTWSKKRPLTEKTSRGNHFNNAKISNLRDGRIAIICDRAVEDDGSESSACIYLWIGDSEGENFGEPRIYPFSAIVPDKLRQLKTGRLIISAANANTETGKLEQYLWYSDDGGDTWSDRVTLAADPRYNLCEVCILEREDGVLVALLRENSFEGYDIMKAISYDGGKTWDGVYRTPMVAGHRPTGGFLRDGRVLVTYRFVPAYTEVAGSVSLGLHNIFATLLRGDELTRKERQGTYFRTMPLFYDKHEKPDTGYTGWVELDEGDIYIVYYIKDDADKAQIRGCRFNLSDIV